MREIINSKFGNLKSSEHFTYWVGDWQLAGNTISVTTKFDDARRVPENVPEKFEEFFISLPKKDLHFRQVAAENLLKLYNGTWSEGETISEAEFAERITLEGLSFTEGDERVEVHYDDGDLFAGHSIKVVATYDGAVISADLP